VAAAVAAEAAPTADLAVATADGRDRSWALEVLLAEGWQPGGPFDSWDVVKDGTRVQVATEHGSGAHKTTRIRVWGETALLPAALQPQHGRTR
jgi:hypothetical protein